MLRDRQIISMMKRPKAGKKVSMVRLQMVEEAPLFYGAERIKNAKTAVEMVKGLCQYSDREMVLVVSLTARLEPVAVEIVAVGGLDACVIDIRNVFKSAILSNAAKIICLHNHPSGNPRPSRADFKVTKQIADAGALLGIRLLDHIVIGAEDYFSMKEAGDLSRTSGRYAA